MNAYDFVHLTFLALGEVKGKTKLQKCVFFLSIATGQEQELGYRAHFYGPYSDDVASAVERLKGLGFLDQTVSSAGRVDPRGFEVARYDYRLNSAGESVAKYKTRKWPNDWEKIREFSKSLKPLLDHDYMLLSRAAKTWFLLQKRKGKASMDDLAALASQFGWEVTPEQVQEAAKMLQKAHLVEIS